LRSLPGGARRLHAGLHAEPSSLRRGAETAVGVIGGKKPPYVRGTGQGGGKSAKEMRAEHQAHIDASPIITRCAFCKWTYQGTALEGRELAKGHRRVAHPEVKPARRRRGSLGRWTSKQEEFREEGLARAKVVAASLAKLEEAS
jgi:hypothetical protein